MHQELCPLLGIREDYDQLDRGDDKHYSFSMLSSNHG